MNADLIHSGHNIEAIDMISRLNAVSDIFEVTSSQ